MAKKKKMKRKQAKSLSARNVIAIRKAAMKGVSTNDIAKKYGSTYGNIFSVIKNRSHTDVKVPGFLVWLKSQVKKKSIPTGKRKSKKVKVVARKTKEVTVAKRPKKEVAAPKRTPRTIAVAPKAPKEIEVVTATVPVEAAAAPEVPHMIPASVVVKRRKKPAPVEIDDLAAEA